ncbi:hypothetical protein C1646_767289 [Rhizophagus diaphanus]|nr:hypothetical protein C1646_767289 [Rhizophagus diaphanus] [Rhizophagus sp. MUCL 43196]
MEIHIGNYLDSNNYTNWKKKSADYNMFKYARNKAKRLACTLDLAKVQEQDQQAQNQEYQWIQR